MDTKKIQSYRRRVKSANGSFGVMGDMMLCIEIDAMTQEERKELQAALASGRAPIVYKYLEQKLAAVQS